MQPLPLPKLGKKEKELLQAIATNDERTSKPAFRARVPSETA